MSTNADATLVSAAMKMGQALVPADTSKIFKEQFEALGKMYTARTKMFTGLLQTGLGIAQKEIDKKKAKKAEFEKRASESIESGNHGDNKRALANALKEREEPATRTFEEIYGIKNNAIGVNTTSGPNYGSSF